MRASSSLFAIAVLLAACGGGQSETSSAASLAPPTEEQALAAQTFMKTTLEPAAEELWNSVGFIIDASGEHDLSPQTDEEWAAVETRVDTLEIFLDGLKQANFAWDASTWSGYVDEVIEAAEANRLAAELHDVEAMYVAGERLDTACESCHLHFEEGEEAGGIAAPL